MATGAIITAVLFAGLALAHSGAGETGLVGPLVAAEWNIDEIPRWAANRLLRGAWHLTSLAWLAMAAIAIGAAPIVVISVTALASGLVMLVSLPGHPAWPVFLVAGAAGLQAEGHLSTTVVTTAAAGAAIGCVALAALHLYWVAGGGTLKKAAVPMTPDGEPTFTPGPLITAAVAGLLLAFGVLILVVATFDEPALLGWLLLAGVALLSVRAIGDTRAVGFTKRQRGTTFADLDDRFFTPIAVFLAMGSAAALLA